MRCRQHLGTDWALEILRVVVGARVDGDARRQRWVLRIKRDATTVARVSRKSIRKGVVKVKGKVRNYPGPDSFTFIARNRTTAERCQGTLTFCDNRDTHMKASRVVAAATES